MKAAVIREQHGEFLFEDITLDEPRADELVVKITAAGLCHTDLAVVDGDIPSPLPVVLGHEGAGEVVAIGSAVTDFAVGDHVAMSFASCGICANCLVGRAAYCSRMMELNFGGARADGSLTLTDSEGRAVHGSFFGQSSFAEYSLVSQHNAVKVPDDLPLRLAGPLGCGIQTGAGAVLNTLNVPAGSSIVVSGTGAVGLSAIMAAKAAGAAIIIAVDIIPARLESALHFGATHAINGKDADVVEQIQKITAGGARYALDTTGNQFVIQNIIAATTFGATVGLIGVSKPEATLPIVMIPGKTIVGVIEGDAVPRDFIPRLVSLHRAGLFPFDELVTFYPFADIQRAIADTQSGAAIKAILTM
ncbi:NAD(P)-dependent alcohol dehydrogenase [Mycetocola spongiae]|uniref:NAD(P)-dependent alcohol dehydrogenase n=1 Tax=Mycetocola spongiae TaxID=2859226 RepID=UPI001CF4CEBD|nr:NAD(P)-dependent alcohol dehydrogenase [Mycetocola spongiae]UCR89350.1 NAD(P)-dependent alcohol dehydrogenase [Mycetocola spongiae]